MGINDHPFFWSICSVKRPFFYSSFSSNHPGAKSVVPHGIERIPSPKQQRRPLPSLLAVTSSMVWPCFQLSSLQRTWLAPIGCLLSSKVKESKKGGGLEAMSLIQPGQRLPGRRAGVRLDPLIRQQVCTHVQCTKGHTVHVPMIQPGQQLPGRRAGVRLDPLIRQQVCTHVQCTKGDKVH